MIGFLNRIQIPQRASGVEQKPMVLTPRVNTDIAHAQRDSEGIQNTATPCIAAIRTSTPAVIQSGGALAGSASTCTFELASVINASTSQ